MARKSKAAELLRKIFILGAGAMSVALGPAAAADAPPGGVIGYLVTDLEWALRETPGGKEECPDGMNVSSREQNAAMSAGGGPRGETSYEEGPLKRFAATWFPESWKEPIPFKEAKGPTAPGLNLDNRIGPNDFTSPEGEPGIDNQMFRALGCADGWRTGGQIKISSQATVKQKDYSRWLLEITGVTDWRNDPEVQVTTYRGLDALVLDGAEQPVAGRTQRIDFAHGARFIHHLRGKIVDGVLITEPKDIVIPWTTRNGYQVASEEWIRDARLKLKVYPDRAEGLLGGYVDIATWYNNVMRQLGAADQLTHVTPPNLYQGMRRLADAYPDESGANTALSGAIQTKFIQVFIQHGNAGQR
jgi:hypothetical protein